MEARECFNGFRFITTGKPVEPSTVANPNETTAGFATWTVGGLLSSGPIYSMGIFYLKRIADAGVVE